VFAVGFENIAWGMGTAAFVALLMALCDHRFTATQYALLSAARLLRARVRRSGRRLRDRPQVPGALVGDVLSLGFRRRAPGLVFVWFLRKEIERAEAASTS